MNLRGLTYFQWVLPALMFLLAESDLFSQDFTIKTYTTDDGLSNNTVEAICRDSTGFLWIATWDGLSRYDGHNFKNYYHIPGDSTSLPFFSVNELVIDKNNDLWILTNAGKLVFYRRNTDNFTYVSNFKGENTGDVFHIEADAENRLIIQGEHRVFRWDGIRKESSSFMLMNSNGQPLDSNIMNRSVLISSDSVMWIIRSKVMKFRHTSGDVFTLVKEYALKKNVFTSNPDFDYREYFRFFVSPAGRVWIFANSGLYLLDNKTGEFTDYNGTIPPGEFSGCRNYYWARFNEGVNIPGPWKNGYRHIALDQILITGTFLKDRDSSIWFAGYSGKRMATGLKHMIFTNRGFRNFLINDSLADPAAVFALTMDKDGILWTGVRGYDHVVLFDKNGMTGQTDRLKSEISKYQTHIRSMAPVDNGIWIGYYLKLLQFYDYSTRQFINYTPGTISVRALLPYDKDNIYIGSLGLFLFHPSTGKTECIWNQNSQIAIYKILKDSKGIIWAPTARSKILRYDPSIRKTEPIELTSDLCNVQDVIEGDENILWIATLGEGVCKYNTMTGEKKFLTTANGLSNNTTYCLLKDASGNIWVSTNDGISMIDKSSELIRIFGQTDGLRISEFNAGAKYVSPSGEFFFGGMGGFVRFYPDSIFSNERLPSRRKIIFTDFRVSGASRLLPVDINSSDTVILGKNETNFHLFFSSSDFINPDKVLYRYRLLGLNDAWTETGPFYRNINYSNLKPRWYRLQLEMTDLNGKWLSPREIVIRITPVFYQTWIFKILFPLFIMTVFVILLRLYIRQVRLKESQKQNELKLQALRGQMNPHFIFNSLNSINYFISKNDRLSANRYIADFARLIRSIMSDMGSEYIPIENELRSLHDYLNIEHLRFGDNFDYKIETNLDGSSGDPEVFPGLVQPFVENAIWHGIRALNNRKGNLIIRFQPVNQFKIKCQVSDDGIGRKLSREIRGNDTDHKSRGIDIVKERLRIISYLKNTEYTVIINDLYGERTETGTLVEVDIPCKYK